MGNFWRSLSYQLYMRCFSLSPLGHRIGRFIWPQCATVSAFPVLFLVRSTRVTIPSLSGLAPIPTQQLIVFSVTITPASTASKALPLLFNICHAALFALIPSFHVDITIGLYPFCGARKTFELTKPENPKVDN